MLWAMSGLRFPTSRNHLAGHVFHAFVSERSLTRLSLSRAECVAEALADLMGDSLLVLLVDLCSLLHKIDTRAGFL